MSLQTPSSARVFVVQVPQRREGGELRPDFDLSPAREWGELVRVLGDDTHAFGDPDAIVDLAAQNLDRHAFGERDYVLLVGQPALIGIVAALVADRVGALRMLQWERAAQRYRLVEARLWDAEDGDQGPALAGVSARG